MKQAAKFQIGELAKLTGCRVVTIRYYEQKGLLPEPARTGSNYRLYGREDVERLQFIRHCRHHGMKLGDIRRLLAFKDNPAGSCRWVGQLMDRHIADVEEQIAELTHLKKHLGRLRRTCSGGARNGCGILKGLNDAAACPYCEEAPCGAGHRRR